MIDNPVIHLEIKPFYILCKHGLSSVRYFTNDIDCVTCKRCRWLYMEDMKRKKKNNDKEKLKEVLNKKQYTNEELERVLIEDQEECFGEV